MKPHDLLRPFHFIAIMAIFAGLACLPVRGQTTPPIQPISVVIDTPTNGANFPSGISNINIVATTRDYGAYVHFVSFLDGTNKLMTFLLDPISGQYTNGYPLDVNYNWPNPSNGVHVLTVIATDTLGRSATSDPVTISVGPVRFPETVVTILATDPIASMVSGDTGIFTIFRTGDTSNALIVFYSIGGTASNGVDYAKINSGITIPAGSNSAQVTITPIKDPFPDPDETVVLQIEPSPILAPWPNNYDYRIGVPSNAVVTILGTNSLPPFVSIIATDPIASMVNGDTGTFTIFRTGDTSNSLDVFYNIGGTASNGVDYITINNSVVIPAGSNSAQITITPIKDPFPDPNETVALQLAPSPIVGPLPDYRIGIPSNAVVTILGTNSRPPFVSIIATDPIAVEPGTNKIIRYFTPLYPTPITNYVSCTNTATFLVRRFDPTAVPPGGVTNSDLTVYYNIGGTASNGVDYVTLPGFVTIPAGKTYALITINPLEDTDASNAPPFSTVILSLTVPPVLNPLPPPYSLGFPSKAEAIILEENIYPYGPPICPLADTSFHVNWPATNGMSYCVQISSNMVDWVPVCTNMVVKDCIQFLDPDAGGLPNRYYRVVPGLGLPSY